MAVKNEKNKTEMMIIRPLRNGFFIVVFLCDVKMPLAHSLAFADAAVSYMM